MHPLIWRSIQTTCHQDCESVDSCGFVLWRSRCSFCFSVHFIRLRSL